MTTRNLVPRADGEGSLGTEAKQWGAMWAKKVYIDGTDFEEVLEDTLDAADAADDAKTQAAASATEAAGSVVQAEAIKNAMIAAYGYPLTAATASAMTDTTKIYVYTGSETGYTFGDWYYHNGTAWTDGGVYNATAFNTDPTLTVPGAAADAQMTGKRVFYKLPGLRNGSAGNPSNANAVVAEYITPIDFNYEYIRVEFVGTITADSFLFGVTAFKGASVTDGLTTTDAYYNVDATKKEFNTSPSNGTYTQSKAYVFRTADLEGYTHFSPQAYASLNGTLVPLRIADNQYCLKYSHEGVMNVDPTFTKSGEAADAKLTGQVRDLQKPNINDLYFAGRQYRPKFTVLSDYTIKVNVAGLAGLYRFKDVNFTYDKTYYDRTFTYAGADTYDVPLNKCFAFDFTNRTFVVTDSGEIPFSNQTVILFYNSYGAVNGPWHKYWLMQLFDEIGYTQNDIYFYGQNNVPTFKLESDYSITVTIPISVQRMTLNNMLQESTFYGGTYIYAGTGSYNVPHNKSLAFDYANRTFVVTDSNEVKKTDNLTVMFFNSHGSINGPWNRYWILQKITEQITVTSDYVKENLNARHIKGNNGTPLTLLHFSDIHADTSALGRIMHEAESLAIDDAICTGDIVNNSAGQITSWWDESVMTCIGNHDSASYSADTGYDWTALSMADRDAYYIAPFESNWGITHTAGTSYYYKDYSTQKVRLIVMDIMLYMSADYSTEATAQTSWLENLLADAITNNLHVLIAIHAPHGGATPKVCSFTKYNQGTMPTDSSCNTPQTVVDTVAAKITAGLKFVGYLVGHTHQDNIWDAENDGKQLIYCVTCAHVSNQNQWKNSDQHRSDTEDAYNLVTIDTTNTLVKIVRGGGADIDDHMRTRKAICFNYTTGEMVGEVL